MAKQVTVGVDVGGTNTAIGVVDQEGNVLAKTSIPTDKYTDANDYLKYVADNIKELLKETPDVEVAGIGMGAPNGNFYKGTIEYAPNLSFEGVINVVDILKTHFEYEHIYLTNDANAAAIGEMVYGGAKGMNDFFMITLGTGVGAGVVSSGKMTYGNTGFAAELGHMVLEPGGRKCGCNKRGCLETYCSAGGIKKTLFELIINDGYSSSLTNKSYDDITSKDIFDAAEAGDAAAIETFRLTGERLGTQLADYIAFVEPEAIFLFGGPTQAGDYIIKPIEKAMNDHCLPIFKNNVKLEISHLKPGDAAIVGASALVWSELEK
jgi:glucokinase